MLESLKIENIAIVESALLELSDGFNVLTGETGAGKSIIIDSINAVLGERTSRELVRTGASNAKVTALFSRINDSVKAKLSEFELDQTDDDTLLLQRLISVEGKNSCRINGCPVTVSMLKSIGSELINIHGQHDNQSLLSPETHYLFIDRLAGNSQLLNEYKANYANLNSLKKELSLLEMDESEKSRRLDILNYQINELEAANLRIGEREELSQQRLFYQNAEKVMQALESAYVSLNGNEQEAGALHLIENAADNLESAGEYLAEINTTAQGIRSVSYDIDEYLQELKNVFFSIDYDPKELGVIEERLDILYRLSRKYGENEEEMLVFLENAKNEAQKIAFSDERISVLKVEIKKAHQKALCLAEKLSRSRREAGKKFAQDVKEELRFLDMPSVTFEVLQKRTELGATGVDYIEFLISANIGEEPKPIAKIASGGELSRIMLAIKNVLSDKDNIQTLIFDEIDAGVSGRAAQKIALKLKSVSKGRQVICVTHLAQIAAQAENHIRISKTVSNEKTYTQVETLDLEGRKNELARIISGLDNVSELQLGTADELLRVAGNI
ncbi:MAG: DNA repair protein RecN [Clostridiales bacterium]|nr:DNA repair protein RecN [Clostridiales bacterium]